MSARVDAVAQTRVMMPAPGRRQVARRRLLAALDAAADARLILLSAPPGAGKSTLLTTWCNERDHATAWLALEPDDDAPGRFTRLLVHSLAQVDPAFVSIADGPLVASDDLDPQSVVIAIVNQLVAMQLRLVIVLDDYQVIRASAIHRAVGQLIDQLPHGVCVALTTRQDPPLRIERYRLRGELLELRQRDLRFTTAEVADYFRDVAGVALSDAETAGVESVTEGWAAGLVAAGLALEGGERAADLASVIRGSERSIFDYLAQEVLRLQTPERRQFLLQTSILERLTGDLCDAVTGHGGGAELLDRLERDNVFVLPLDRQRTWYRYHHLFAGFLRQELSQDGAADVAALHARACDWLEMQGHDTEAIEHAFAAGDAGRAAVLMEQSVERDWGYAAGRGQDGQRISAWFDRLPVATRSTRPALAAAAAWAALNGGDLRRAVELTGHLERWAERRRDDDDRRGRTVAAEALSIQAMAACFGGEPARAVELSRSALDLTAADDARLVALNATDIAVNLQYGYGAAAEVEHAAALLLDATHERAGSPPRDAATATMSLTLLAELRQAQGRLGEAQEHFAAAEQRAARSGRTAVLGGVAAIGMASILTERNQLADAREILERAITAAESLGSVTTVAAGYLLKARLLAAAGKPAGALDLARATEELGQTSDVGWISSRAAALHARLALQHNHQQVAREWAARQHLDVGDAVGYRRELEYTTLIRVLLDQGDVTRAAALIDWLYGANERSGFRGSALELLVLRALLLARTDDHAAAARTLNQALAIAAPERYVRLFVEEGERMAEMLTAAAGAGHPYAEQLLQHVGAGNRDDARSGARPDPLTAREQEVLRLLATGLSNRQISERLFVAIGTVKRHVHNIHQKLEVGSRLQAVARARMLGLLRD